MPQRSVCGRVHVGVQTWGCGSDLCRCSIGLQQLTDLVKSLLLSHGDVRTTAVTVAVRGTFVIIRRCLDTTLAPPSMNPGSDFIGLDRAVRQPWASTK